MASSFFEPFFGAFRRKVPPTERAGTIGVSVHGGIVENREKDQDLSGVKRYETYSEALANTSIVAAGTRYFLNLVAKSGWQFEPSEADPDGKWAELAEEMLTSDPLTPWHRIVRRAAMYRFYGFSVQEWTAGKRDDGWITFADVEPRAQLTIERWDLDKNGRVVGMLQESPQTGVTLYIPRAKTAYLVDDTLNDSPEGLGLLRHVVPHAKLLKYYTDLETIGFEVDLRGVPIARAPIDELNEKVKAGTLNASTRAAMLAPLEAFLAGHVKSEKLGLMLDSSTYRATDGAQAPSAELKWGMELLTADTSGAQGDVAKAIERLNREMARILNVEGLLLGGDSAGSFALSKDKSNNLFLVVDGTLVEIRESFKKDLLEPLWTLNGLPPETMPTMKTETVQFKDVEQIGATLREMASAGAVLGDDDPAIGEVRDLLGLSRPPEITLEEEEDLSLTSDTTVVDENKDDVTDVIEEEQVETEDVE